MAKPLVHAQCTARKFGGLATDYLHIHDFMDSPKQAHASVKFRVIFHSSFGIFLVEKFFGHALTNSDGLQVSVRDVAEQHVLEDLGFIPSLDEYLQHMEIAPWMGGVYRRPIKIAD